MIFENPHWTKERWELEKQNTINCFNETSAFIDDNNNLGIQEVIITTVDGFDKAMKKRDLLKKLETKKNYKIYLQNKLNNIDEKISSLN